MEALIYAVPVAGVIALAYAFVKAKWLHSTAHAETPSAPVIFPGLPLKLSLDSLGSLAHVWGP